MEKDYLKSPREIVSVEEQPFPHSIKLNRNLTYGTLSLEHLRIYLNLKFTSLKQAGLTAGLSYSRVKQIITGKYLPSKPELIKQIADGWNIDPIKLTQLFERLRE